MSYHSCWDCGWRTSGGITLLGNCYAYIKERGGPMEIQATKRQDGKYLADVGCKKWTGEKQDFSALRGAKIIEEEL